VPSLVAAVVVGSVARGDFNHWSDLDVLVVADDLPDRWLDRCEALAPVPPGLQPIGWTPNELAARRRRRDPIALEAGTVGVTVWGTLPPAPADPA
jgi:predicted nucleotidyltransferase